MPGGEEDVARPTPWIVWEQTWRFLLSFNARSKAAMVGFMFEIVVADGGVSPTLTRTCMDGRAAQDLVALGAPTVLRQKGGPDPEAGCCGELCAAETEPQSLTGGCLKPCSRLGRSRAADASSITQGAERQEPRDLCVLKFRGEIPLDFSGRSSEPRLQYPFVFWRFVLSRSKVADRPLGKAASH